MAASKTIIVKLVSSAGTGFYYTTTKTQGVEGKLELMKYDPVVRQKVLFKEVKKLK